MILRGVVEIKMERRKRVPLEGTGTGFTTVSDGYDICEVLVEVDALALANDRKYRLREAKRGITKMAAGAIKLTIQRQRPEGGAS